MLTELHIEDLGVIERARPRARRRADGASPARPAPARRCSSRRSSCSSAAGPTPTIVRAGAAEARVDGRFVVGDDEVVLTRVVPGRRALAGLRRRAPGDRRRAGRAAAGLVDLHGQHAHQSLLAGADPARRARPRSAASTWRRCGRRGPG